MNLLGFANRHAEDPRTEGSFRQLQALKGHQNERLETFEPAWQLPLGWILRPRLASDHEGIRLLMLRVYPPPHGPECVWSAANLEQHLRHFADGQLVIQDGRGTLRATSSTMRVNRERALAPHTWLEITEKGTLRTHEPEGEFLYGVNIAVDPVFQGLGLGRALYDSRFRLGRSLGCTAFAAGARIPGFHRVASWCSPREYVRKVAAGELHDPTLSKQLALGFQVAGVLLDYAFDHETLGHAALIIKNL